MAAGYRLRSELARRSLGRSGGTRRDRLLIWVNTVSALVLMIGVAGHREPRSAGAPGDSGIRAPRALPVVFQPPAATPPAAIPVAGSMPAGLPPAGVVDLPAPPVVVAALHVEGLEFPVVVESAAARSADPLLATPPVERAAASPDADPGQPGAPGAPVSGGPADGLPAAVFRPGSADGAGGSYPAPVYPRDASRRGEQGEVRLWVEVDTAGRPVSVEVRDSSGSALLDRSAAAHIRRFWRWPPGGRRQYIVPVDYRLE